ncbi:MAG: N-acetylmuramoyl-L-alanine amidase [Lachnospiraceae bacterium]|nr:N-acetylmuramoyl-L-alanine amidase [Lachnospiraceae bacterium]
MSETVGNIYNIYKKTLIFTLICAVILIGGAFAYMQIMHPAVMSGLGSRGVQEISHGVLGTMANAGVNDDSSGKVMSTNNADNSGKASATGAAESKAEGTALFLNGASAESDYLWVPVADGISSSDITIENHYMDRQLWVSIAGGDSAYYGDEYISGNLEGVMYGAVIDDADRIILRFDMDRVYEYNTIFENGVLYIEKMRPREVYDRIVVIDPAGYAPSELINHDSLTPARICQDISAKLLTLLEADGIRVYVTSLDERVAVDDDSLALLTEVHPDMYIRIETSYDEDSKVYGTETVYNGTYFIPGFGSVELADLLEANVTTAIGGKAVGLAEAGENDAVIRKATVPAATIKVGYYTNTQENILLNRDDYRSRIAEGIAAAIASAYSEE